MNDDIRESGLGRWRDVASSLDSHKASTLNESLREATCSLWEPSDEEIQRLEDVAEEEGLRMQGGITGYIVEGTSFTVREVNDE